MKRITMVVLGAALVVHAVPLIAAEMAPQEAAGAAAGRLGKEMRKRLMEAMQKNGPAGAIDVCARDASVISAAIEKDYGVAIKRTALLVRNPQNAPDPEERSLLERLAAMQKAGTPIPEEVAAFPGTPGRRFYKPIMMAQPCLKCHGDTAVMGEDVKRELAARYPQDKGTGYREGELRGIISVTVK